MMTGIKYIAMSSTIMIMTVNENNAMQKQIKMHFCTKKHCVRDHSTEYPKGLCLIGILAQW